jgi:dTDP-4-amino-4,6-dideoxygalactose transaminase
MIIPFFDYLRQFNIIKKPINAAINKVFDSGQLILGTEVKNFENNFSNYIKAKYGIGVNSGTDAIKIALRALGVKGGDEVITVANTAIPTVSAIRELDAIPVFVDIKDDFTIDEKLIAKAITKKTKVILPVHLYGRACNMPAILKIAKKYKLKIVEDCAQAQGTMINGKKVGTFGEIGCFSFYPTKNLGAYGDGGMILTSDKKLAESCRQLRMYGIKNGYKAEIEGYNSRLDEIQAAILNVKLNHLDKWNNRRQQIAKIYLSKIRNKKIFLPQIDKIENHVFHQFVIMVEDRSDLLKYLSNNKIGYGIHYPHPIHLQPAYKFLGHKKGDLPNTEIFANKIVSLPIFPELNIEELKFIVKTINNF